MSNEIIQATLENYQCALTVFACLFVLERIRPVEEKQPFAGIVFNLIVAVVLTAVTQMTMRVLVNVLPPMPFHPLLTVAPPTTWQGKIGCEILVLFLYDFFAYWMHRIEHCVPLLWRMHKLHHAEEHMNVTTTNRHHPLEAVLRVPFVLLPLVTLFDLPFAPLAFGVSLGVLLPSFSHMNLRLDMGRFTPILIGPQLHRLHHSSEDRHFNKNFANIFPVWDILFGTYLAPQKGEFPPTGLKSAGIVDSYVGALPSVARAMHGIAPTETGVVYTKLSSSS
jgi:sterol desaturase/sphingolipid hydroxylase (fatty acid hydroxylase superfamily)